MIRRPVRLPFLFLILFCIWNDAGAQLLNIRNYSVEEGLPQSQIHDILQDKAGNIWFATNGGGASRYDGFRFHNYGTRNGLSNNRVYDIFEDASGTVWLGTGRGLNRYHNGQLSTVNHRLIDKTTIYRIYRHSDGNLWLGTSSGIVIYDGNTFSSYRHNDSLGEFQVWAIQQDHLGNTWIATMMNGVFLDDGKTITRFGLEDGLLDLKNRDLCVNGDKIWIGTYRGVNIYDMSKAYLGKQKLQRLEIDGKPYQDPVYRFYRDSSGVVWIGNSRGVSKLEYNRSRLITPANGLCATMICGITQDREGNMWFGAFGGGVSKYSSDLFININESHGLAHNTVMSFYKDSKERLWIGTWGGGASVLDYNAWLRKDTLIINNFTMRDGLAQNNIWSICEDRSGNIWFGTSGNGVSVYDGKKFRSYHLKEGLSGVRIQALHVDRKGNVWIGHENGVDRYDGKTFTCCGQTQGISAEGVNAIYEDNKGDIWFASTDRISRYDGRNYHHITSPAGFPRVRNISRDHLGYLWFSTDAGVTVYNGKTFLTIDEESGLSSNTVYFTCPDDNNNLWLGTSSGLDRLDISKFVNEKKVSIRHYGKDEGFVGLECNPNAYWRDPYGRLWVGTIQGITIYDPNEERPNRIEPQTTISGIRLFLEDFDYKLYSDSIIGSLPLNLKLPYDQNHITFDFIGISQTIPGKVKYQYMLEGFDKSWLPEVKTSNATYSNLPPGKYTFLVKASNNDGLWNKQPARFSFEILAPLWRRPWFYVVSVLIAVLCFYLYVRMRERNLQRSRIKLKEEVAIRTRELELEKEKLQLAYSEIDEKNKDITDSIHYAKRIQEAILPPDTLFRQYLPDTFVLYKPKAIVSGDFYWLEHWGHQTFVAAVDCTGHGVPGAFMSIVAHNILTQTVNVLGLTKPGLILNETNSQLSKKLNQNPEEATVRDGMDIAMISINHKAKMIEFAGANNPVWILREGKIIEVNGDKFPIGAFVGEELQKFTNHEWALQSGDTMYLFTDGFADQFGGPRGKKFKYKQFKELLLSVQHLTMAEQRTRLDEVIENWRGDLEQVDDILVIGVRLP